MLFFWKITFQSPKCHSSPDDSSFAKNDFLVLRSGSAIFLNIFTLFHTFWTFSFILDTFLGFAKGILSQTFWKPSIWATFGWLLPDPLRKRKFCRGTIATSESIVGCQIPFANESFVGGQSRFLPLNPRLLRGGCELFQLHSVILFRARFYGAASKSPINPDSCCSSMTWDGVAAGR